MDIIHQLPLPLELQNKILLYSSHPIKNIIDTAMIIAENYYHDYNYNDICNKKKKLFLYLYFNSNDFDENDVIDLDIISNYEHKWNDCKKIEKLCIQEKQLYDFWMGKAIIIHEL